MLKYTLGALAALIILSVTAFLIIASVNKSDARGGPAPSVIFTLHEDGTIPNTRLTAPAGKIIDLQLNNRSDVSRFLGSISDDVYQLPQAVGEGARPGRNGIEIIAPRQSVGSGLVRFEKPGTYELSIGYTGLYVPPAIVIIVAE